MRLCPASFVFLLAAFCAVPQVDAVEHRPIVPPNTKTGRLLRVLAEHPGQRVSRSVLAERVWPELKLTLDEPHDRERLRGIIHQAEQTLKRLLEAEGYGSNAVTVTRQLTPKGREGGLTLNVAVQLSEPASHVRRASSAQTLLDALSEGLEAGQRVFHREDLLGLFAGDMRQFNAALARLRNSLAPGGEIITPPGRTGELRVEGTLVTKKMVQQRDAFSPDRHVDKILRGRERADLLEDARRIRAFAAQFFRPKSAALFPAESTARRLIWERHILLGDALADIAASENMAPEVLQLAGKNVSATIAFLFKQPRYLCGRMTLQQRSGGKAMLEQRIAFIRAILAATSAEERSH